MDTAVNPVADALAAARRLVVKVGSSLLVDAASGLRRAWLDSLAADVAARVQAGARVVIVSSGAIALGKGRLGLASARRRLADAQAAAAVGQIALAHAYEAALGTHGLVAAQMLLTLSDLEGRRTYLNARETLERLLQRGAVPVINENDSTATEEIRFGDNDRLAARVAQMVSADLLILLSDVDGLYTSDPARDPSAAWIGEVPALTPAIEAMAGRADALGPGSGGMVTKLAAARIATDAGVAMAIAKGSLMHPLAALASGARATLFHAAAPRGRARKLWLAGRQRVAGALVVDAGAARALMSGRSLLPAGLIGVEGHFERGDVVAVKNGDGQTLGRGLAAYSAWEASRLTGAKSRDIAARLGYARGPELVHRDDLVMEMEEQ
ncbi:MAG: glutamate 5-kinase [Alphaproteobacteria bacterium]|nr:MAG: glutamate 5-kinase [Alphaproteobacteria bacterium]